MDASGGGFLLREVPRRELSLFDSTCLIVGIIVGAGIYQTAPDVARGAACWWGLLVLWIAGGAVAACGALGYAELSSAYPQAGGDYVYLTRAYGRWAGFLFGWIQLSVVRPGDIALMAFVLATYARTLYDPLAGTALPCAKQIYACGAVIALTAINVAGVREGKWTQNGLTVAKVLGLIAVIVVATIAPPRLETERAVSELPLSVAMILVLFTFGGWNEIAYIAAEVKAPDRNLSRALLLGVATVTALYLLANGAFLRALGYAGLAESKTVAVEAVSPILPAIGARLIGGLICLSALGAVNGLVMTGARISYAVGTDHSLFHRLGRWHPGTQTPATALIVQAAIAVTLILVLGSFADTILYTAPVVYAFQLATSLAVIVLRSKEPHVKRPFRVRGYPVTTLGFCAVCAFLMYSAIAYRPWVAAGSCGLALLGVPLYWIGARWLAREP